MAYGILRMLESTLNSPFQTFCRTDMYPTLQQKAARVAFINHTLKNYTFKRIFLLLLQSIVVFLN